MSELDRTTPNGNSKAEASSSDKDQLLRDAAIELRLLREELEMRDAEEHEPIAIIGMSCRLPGGVDNPQEFWSLLVQGKDAICEVPSERWDVNQFYDPDPEASGKMYTRHGGFIDDVDLFDPHFFGISPREAKLLDPQQRLLLECTYHAFEDAGIPVHTLQESNTGVYVGLSLDDYAQRSVRSGDNRLIDPHSALGSQRAIAAGRLAYTFGLQGPVMQIDTTCSSSLVSVHLACQAIQRQEADLALVGGVNLMLAPQATIACCKLRALSTDGRCRTFSNDASGYGRGEGCGLLVLKKLSAAQSAGDRVHAVIRGSAINHDGQSNGLTAPNATAQTKVIQSALKAAQLKGDEIDYVEAHGTGTPLGDPIELEALAAAIGKRNKDVIVGSVKTNIGHLESAAGIAGLMKVILALQHECIPAHLHCEEPSKRIDWRKLNIKIPNQVHKWTAKEKPRRAGVSSFGMSGTNAHVIVESVSPVVRVPNIANSSYVLPISARSESALDRLLHNYDELLESDDVDLDQLCRAAANTRSHYAFRHAYVAQDKASMQATIRNSLQKGEVKNTITAQRVVFFYTGQGAQYRSMGRQLYTQQAVFRNAMDECDAAFKAFSDQSLVSLLYAETDENFDQHAFQQTSTTQPLMFALQYALTALWSSWGIQANAVIGHSVGEFAAACAAGCMQWLEGFKLITQRARLMQSMSPGSMLAARTSAAEIEKLFDAHQFTEKLVISAINSSQSVVISGENQAIESLIQVCETENINAQKLSVSHAFHSTSMQAAAEPLARAASEVNFQSAKIEWISSMNGKSMKDKTITADYWSQQLTQPVLFADAVKALDDLHDSVLIEIGPSSTLLNLVRADYTQGLAYLPSLRAPINKKSRDIETIFSSLSCLYKAGLEINWQTFNQSTTAASIELPKYPFDRERYWIQSKQILETTDTSLLSCPGKQLEIAGDNFKCFEMNLNENDANFCDHKIHSRVLWPAAAHILNLFAAVENESQQYRLCDLKFRSPLWVTSNQSDEGDLNDDNYIRVQTQLTHQSTHWHAEILSLQNEKWLVHSNALLKPCAQEAERISYNMDEFFSNTSEEILSETFYKSFVTRGIDYGPAFQCLKEIHVNTNQAIAHLSNSFANNTAILDAALQLCGLFVQQRQGTLVPVKMDEFVMFGSLSDVSYVMSERKQRKLNCYWLAHDGSILAQLQGLHLHALEFNSTANDNYPVYFNVEWQEQPLQQSAATCFAGVAEIVPSLKAQFSEVLSESEAKAYLTVLPMLDSLAFNYINTALMELENEKVSSHHQKLFNYLQTVDVENSEADVNPDVLCSKILSTCPQVTTELDWIQSVGSQLVNILRGEQEALSVLFPNADDSRLYELYAQSLGARLINHQLLRTLDQLLIEKSDQPLRVLEIGAGTGGTTVHVLEQFAKEEIQVDYCFTDISQGLLQSAAKRFANHTEIRFELLDIEQTNKHAKQFDLVIASNVLHATKDIKKSLENILEFLVPSGRLLFIEGTQSMLWLDLVFGITPGWWRFTDYERRSQHPLLSTSAWKRACEEAGFINCETLTSTANNQAPQNLFIAESPQTAVTWALMGEQAFAIALADAITSSGGRAAYTENSNAEVAENVALVLPLTNRKCPDVSAREFSQRVFNTLQSLHSIATIKKFVVICSEDNAAARLACAPLKGLIQAFAIEQTALQIQLIMGNDFNLITAELISNEYETQILLHDHQRKVARIASCDSSPPARKLQHHANGVMGDMNWVEIGAPSLGKWDVEIEVKASGLNFRDVMIALGVYPDVAELGCECVGNVITVGEQVTRVQPGDRVMAIGAGMIASQVVTNENLVSRLPSSLDWIAAASLPVAFATAYQALVVSAKLQAEDSVLIHCATGGVGQAAVQIAKSIGATIFATASQSKWKALRELDITHPLDSRDTDFAKQLHQLTQGRGVDVVLNSLPGEFRRCSLDVLADGGRFVEIGKGDGMSAEEMQVLRPDVIHHQIDLGVLSSKEPKIVGEALDFISTSVANGELQALPVTCFDDERVVEAFKCLQQARHIGKLVVQQVDSSSENLPIEFDQHAAYLITGGLGALGILTAEWMVSHGARRLIYISRREDLDEAQQQHIESLRELGVEIELLSVDVSDQMALSSALKPWTDDKAVQPLRGIVHAAGVMHDGLLSQLSWQQFNQVLKPKLDGAWHLHEITQSLNLDFFVMYSSAAGLFGAPGQTNHAAANSFLDELADYRRNAGLPALSIAWGPWSEVGAALKYANQGRLSVLPGIGTIHPEQGLEYLSQVWKSKQSRIAIVPLVAKEFQNHDIIKSQPYYADLFVDAAHDATQPQDDSLLLQKLRAASSNERKEILDHHLCHVVAEVLEVEPDRLDRSTGFFDLGFDSLTALELKSRLQRDLAIDLPDTLIFDYPSLDALIEYLGTQVLSDNENYSNTEEIIESEQNAVDESRSEAQISRQDTDQQIDEKLDQIDALLSDVSESTEQSR